MGLLVAHRRSASARACQTQRGPPAGPGVVGMYTSWVFFFPTSPLMMMNEEGAKPSLLCVLLQPTTTYINREK